MIEKIKFIFFPKHKSGNDLKEHGGKRQLLFLILMLLILPALAGLQHHYLGKLSEAEYLRFKTNLEYAAKNFSEDFDSELTRIRQVHRFDENLPEKFEPQLQQAYLMWKQEATFPDLVRGIYSLEFTDGEPSLYTFDLHRGIFSNSDWPFELECVRSMLSGASDQASSLIPLTQAPLLYKYPLIISECLNCRISGNVGGLSPVGYLGYLIIVLDPDIIQKGLIPSLCKRHFPIQSSLCPDIVISKQNKPGSPFYISSPELDIDDFSDPEVRMEIGKWTNRDPVTIKTKVFYMENTLDPGLKAMDTAAIQDAGKTPIPLSGSKILKIPVDHIDSWELMLKYNNDTLEDIVNRARYRNHILSYLILTILGASMVMVHISTRRANALARRQLKFVSGVSHELRTPLSVIRSAGENLADGLISDIEQQKKYGRLIRDEGRRLSTMVENILSFSALQNDKTALYFQAVDIKNLLEECITGRPASSDIQYLDIRIESDNKAPLVDGDSDSLKIVFNNIIENAIKYSPNGSPILIRVKHITSDNLLEVCFEDSGRGIDPEDMPHVLSPFFRGKNTETERTPGSGIGLSLVNEIIDKHGGKVEVKSQRHKGTTVSIFLPVKKNE